MVADVCPNFVEMRLWTNKTEDSKIDKVDAMNFPLSVHITGVSHGENVTYVLK